MRKIFLRQHTLGQVTTTGVNAPAFASNVLGGSLIVVAMTYYGGGSDYFSSVADGVNTYVQVGLTRSGNGTTDFCRLYYAKNVAAGATTVSVSFSGAPGAGDTMVGIYEYLGVDTVAPLDTTNPGGTGTGTTPSPGAVTPTVNGCLIFSAGLDDNGNNATPTANTGAGYVLEDHQDDSTNHERFYTEDFVQGIKASTTASFTIGTSSNWAIQAGVFKPSLVGDGIQLRQSVKRSNFY